MIFNIIQVENEEQENLYHCGYTGLCKTDKENQYLLVYYIKNDNKFPIIKSCLIDVEKD